MCAEEKNNHTCEETKKWKKTGKHIHNEFLLCDARARIQECFLRHLQLKTGIVNMEQIRESKSNVGTY